MEVKFEAGRFKVWCSLDERGPLELGKPSWEGSALSPDQAAVEASKAFTRGDPGLTPLYCHIELEGSDDNWRRKVVAEPSVTWKTEML